MSIKYRATKKSMNFDYFNKSNFRFVINVSVGIYGQWGLHLFNYEYLELAHTLNCRAPASIMSVVAMFESTRNYYHFKS